MSRTWPDALTLDVTSTNSVCLSPLGCAVQDKESRSIAESAYEYDEKLKALNTTVKALYGKAKILGLLESKTTNTSVFIGKNEMRDLAILGYGK